MACIVGWMLLVYFPLAHMVWGVDGFMNGVWNANAGIKAIDNHAHVVRAVDPGEEDHEYDALPFELLEGFPRIDAYLERIEARPARQRAQAVGQA